jgi:hypothetical protein
MAKKRVYRAKTRTKERTATITIRCTPPQKLAIKLVARSKNKTVSALLLGQTYTFTETAPADPPHALRQAEPHAVHDLNRAIAENAAGAMNVSSAAGSDN